MLLWKLVYILVDVWSEIMFWFVFFTTSYWFISFKLQANAYILLPSIDEWSQSYMIFDIIFGLILGFRFVAVVMRIVEQSTLDIFFIDWEAPDPYMRKADVIDNTVVWRSIFVANEFNELQTEYRYINPTTTLIWFAFFLKGLGWEYLSEAMPHMNASNNPLTPENYVLKFFLSAFIFLCIMAVQYVIEGLTSYFGSLKFQEFMDLCSVSNVSLLIMDENFHGYYIHGKAPAGKADLILSELIRSLDAE